jgi:CRP-like cAMP-binding protein
MVNRASPFERLPEAAREAMLAAGQRRTYKSGDVIFHQGDYGDALHLLRTGRAAARVTTPAGDVVTLRVMAPGDIFGELSMFTDAQERTASIVALDDVETLSLRRPALDQARAQHREIDDALLEVLSRRIDHLSQLVAEAYFVSADKRVARRLYEVGRLYVGEALPVTVPLTQEDLAAMAGTTRPTANQALQRLVGLGVISLSRGRIEIHDPNALRARTGW